MLKSLYISNYALIDELSITFEPGFTIISGETGAGKSIILGALSLILGSRADIVSLRDPEKKCIAEGVFDVSKYDLSEYFSDNDIDFDKNTIIRREINSKGKSRAFINDTPVNLQILKELSLKLIDIHSQHNNLELSDNRFQLKVIDAFASNREILNNYKEKFLKFQSIQKAYNELLSKSQQEKADADYIQFRFDELEKAGLKEDEQETLEQEQKELEHAEEIKSALTKSYEILRNESYGISTRLRESVTIMQKAKKFYSRASEFYDRLNSVEIELNDLGLEIESSNEDIDINPERLQYVNKRLDYIYSLQQKYSTDSIRSLLIIKEELQQKLNSINSYDDLIKEQKELLYIHKKEVLLLAETLSKSRIKVFKPIQVNISDQLKNLGMPVAQFVISHEKEEKPTIDGIDRILFLFSANKNMPAHEISKVASGGEISRLMLSIKALIANSIDLPTIVFDEIDTGVSGEIADKMGKIMSNISKNLQVIDITHLPQVAAKADNQYLVYKEHGKSSTRTGIKLLNSQERINEIAKMLSGENISTAAIENAKALLENRN